MAVKGQQIVKAKTEAELDQALNTGAAEIEFETPADDSILEFEGGEFAGQRMTPKEFQKLHAGVDEEDPVPPEAKADGEAGASAATEAKPDQAAAEGGERAEATEVDPAAEATAQTGAEAEAGEAASETQAEPAYQPNFAYKVYDETKEFPEWAKPLVTSKETEDHFRTALQKSDAFDMLKPKHETVIRERDSATRAVHEHIAKVQRSAQLRDRDMDQWLHEMGVSDDALLRHAANVAAKKQDAAAWAAFEAERATKRQTYERELQALEQPEPTSPDNPAVRAHQGAWDAMNKMPDVVSFRERMDAVYGEGAFDQALRTRGSLVFKDHGYVPPHVHAQWVMETYGKSLPAQPTPQPKPASTPAPAKQPAPQGAKPAQGASAAPAPKPATPAPARVKSLPNAGRGVAGASPTRQRPRSLDDLKKQIDKELGS